MKNILIVVDYQNDSVCGSLGFPGAKAIEEAICKKIKYYISKNDKVLFTLDTHFDNKHEQWKMFHENGYYDSWGWELYNKVKDLKTDDMITISKHTYGSPDLFRYLLNNQYDNIEFAGIMTNVCVISNVIIAQTASPEARIQIDESCVAAENIELHEKALDIMESLKIHVIGRN